MKKAANHTPTSQIPQLCDVSGLGFKVYFGSSPTIQTVRNKALLYARDRQQQSVLITGEEGTGKLIMARFIHNNSPYLKHKNLFVRVDCAAIDKGTIQSALFGHRKGAFTGAGDHHTGYFAEARGGSLFVDEIGTLPLELQPKLLNVIEYGIFRPMKGLHDETTDARLISATNCDLAEMCRRHEFKHDLYSRLKKLCLHLPALRDCRADIKPMAEFFFEKYRILYEIKPKIKIHPEVFRMLLSYHFPGNVRELDNIISLAVLLISQETKKEIGCEHLTFENNTHADSPDTAKQHENNPHADHPREIEDYLEQNAHLWQGLPSNKVPCLLHMEKKHCDEINTVYRLTAYNKAVTARLLGTTVGKLRGLKRRHND